MTTFRIHRSSEWSLPRTVSLTGAIAVHACAIVLLAMPMMRPGTIAAIAEPIQVIWHSPEPVPVAVPVPPEPQLLPRPKRPAPVVAAPIETPPTPMSVPTPVGEPAPIADETAIVDAPPTAVEGATRGADVRLGYIDTRAPRYPRESIRDREEGTVLLRVFVDRDGRPTTVELVRSSGHARLDRAASDSVRGWRFRPVQVDGVAVPASGLVPVAFNLARG
jgi:periplasmic protein TonB